MMTVSIQDISISVGNYNTSLISVADIGFNPSVYTVNEQGSSVVLTVVNRNPNLERDVVVQVGTVSGSAREGSVSHIREESDALCGTL